MGYVQTAAVGSVSLIGTLKFGFVGFAVQTPKFLEDVDVIISIVKFVSAFASSLH